MDKITNLLVPILLIEMMLSTGLGISWSGQANRLANSGHFALSGSIFWW
jgi:hypothetical protein